MTLNHDQAETVGTALHDFLSRMMRGGEYLPFGAHDLVWADAAQHVLASAAAVIAAREGDA